MRKLHLFAAFCLTSNLFSLTSAAEPPQVLISDGGVQTVTIGPGAPPHTVGLKGHRHVMVMDTGARSYALRYAVALNPNDPRAAIPGEGYIGMPQPSGQNWYAGGFFDVQLNGKSIGGTLLHSLTGRSSGPRGTVDFVFDAPQALVRVRFVAEAGSDCVYAQVLLEPKEEINSVRVLTRCYPSGFTTDGERHVQTATRDFAQGERATLNVEDEWWTFYYDRIYDAGYVGVTRSGVGPCAMLWLPAQTEQVGFTVGGYGTETAFDLKPKARDYRFVFFDYAGTKNEAAKNNLRQRSHTLREEWQRSPSPIRDWPIGRWRRSRRRFKGLAAVPDDTEAVARYDRWARELAAQLKLLRIGSAGAIMAEADAAKTIADWERGLPSLKLQALLNEI